MRLRLVGFDPRMREERGKLSSVDNFGSHESSLDERGEQELAKRKIKAILLSLLHTD